MTIPGVILLSFIIVLITLGLPLEELTNIPSEARLHTTPSAVSPVVPSHPFTVDCSSYPINILM